MRLLLNIKTSHFSITETAGEVLNSKWYYDSFDFFRGQKARLRLDDHDSASGVNPPNWRGCPGVQAKDGNPKATTQLWRSQCVP